MELLNIDKIPQGPAKKISEFIEEFGRCYPKGIEMIALYGSLASGDYKEGKSDINLLFILEDLSLESLKEVPKLLKRFRKAKLSTPLFFTREYINRSLDSFPMEFLELKENHLLLYGKDLLEDIQVNRENLRLQVEQIIKGRLLRIRQWYLEGGSRGQVRRILEFGIKDILPALRNFLRLKGIDPPPLKREELVKELEKATGQDLNFIPQILESNYIAPVEKYLDKLISFLDKISLIVDGL